MSSYINARTIIHQNFDDKGYTDENTIANAYLSSPDKITPVLTHLMGQESDKFPLTFLTEGQGKKGIGYTIAINDVQFEWKVIGRLRRSSVIGKTDYTGSDEIGKGNGYFFLYMKDKWLKKSHSIHSEKGVRARIMREPERAGTYWKYFCQLANPDPNATVPFSEVGVGKRWAMVGAASVSESDSEGTESSVQTPGTLKNQINIIRKSYTVAGNVSNKTVECELTLENGTKTRYFTEFERWQHEMNFRQDKEEELWYSEYNRTPDGKINMIDEDSGKPIPMGAGVFQQIPNNETYSELTEAKIRYTIGDLFHNSTDTGKMTMVGYCGEGFLEDFDLAMKKETKAWSLLTSDMFVSKYNGGLKFGQYFKAYEHIDGHMVIFKTLPMLENGSQAEIAPIHPRSGKRITSHSCYFIDQSTYDGELNLKMIYQKDRSMRTGIELGMADIKGADYNGNNKTMRQVSTGKDRSSIHFLATQGINIRRNTHCLALRSDMA